MRQTSHHPRRRFSVIGMAGLMLVGISGLASAQTAAPRTGAAIFKEACQQCHGTNGRGVPAAVLGLPVQPRDLTDCQAGPREGDADWLAIIRDGGPARAFHPTMPALGGALSDAELRLVLAHARTLCTDASWPRGELNFPKAIATEKAFPEDELLITQTVDLEGDGGTKTKAVYEKRFGPRNQIEFVVPISAHPVNGSWTAGVGDMAFAFKRVLVASHARGSIVSVTGELIMPTASATDGWGAGHAAFEPFLTAGQRCCRGTASSSSRAVLHSRTAPTPIVRGSPASSSARRSPARRDASSRRWSNCSA